MLGEGKKRKKNCTVNNKDSVWTVTNSSWHPPIDILIPSHASNPLLSSTGLRMSSDIVSQAAAYIVKGRSTKEVDRMEKLAILEQVAVTVPDTRNDEPRTDGQARVVPGEDAGELSIFYSEALGHRLVDVVGTDALIAVRLRAPSLLLRQRVGSRKRAERLLEPHHGQGDDARHGGGEAQTPPYERCSDH